MTNNMPIEEIFEITKTGFLATAEVQIDIAKRVDNLLNLRELASKFWGEYAPAHVHNLDYLKDLQNLSIKTYEKVYELAKEKFVYEEFIKEDMPDLIGEIIPKVKDIETEQELLEAMIIFLTVKPYAEKMLGIHNQIQEEIIKREYEESQES